MTDLGRGRSLRRRLLRQFGRPEGILGWIAGWIMATRPSNRRRNLWTVSLLGIVDGDRVLEIGFGPGVALEACLAPAARAAITGLEHSDAMVRSAARRLPDAVREGRLRLERGGLDRLGEWKGRFDKIFSVNVIQFLPERRAAVRAMHDALAPGGTLATTYMPRQAGAGRAEALRLAAELSAELAETGFQAVRIEELPLRPVPAVCVIGQRRA